MDYEYWLRLGKAGTRFSYFEERLAGSRLYADNKTLGFRVNVHKEINDMFKKLFGVVPDQWLFNYAHAVVGAKLNRDAAPTRYVLEVGLKTLFSAMHWNRRVSVAMRQEIKRWLLGR